MRAPCLNTVVVEDYGVSCLVDCSRTIGSLEVTARRVQDLSGISLAYVCTIRCTSLLTKISSTLQTFTKTEVNQAKSLTP